MRKFLMVLWVIALVVLAACGGAASPTAAPSGDTGGEAQSAGGPADAMRAFIETTYSGDMEAAAAMYCAAVPADAANLGIQQQEGVTYDLSGLTYTVVSESGDVAEVEVAGTLSLSIEAGGQTTTSSADFPATTYTLRNEGGWKLCPA